MTPIEPTGEKPAIAAPAKSGRKGANAAPIPRISIPKLLMLFACFVLYTACVIVGTMRYCERQYLRANPPSAQRTSSVIRYQKLNGEVLYMTPEEFDKFKRSDQASSGAKIEEFTARPAPSTGSGSTPQPTETFELPAVPDLKDVRERNGRPPKELAIKADTQPVTTPRDSAPSPLKNGDTKKKVSTPPAQPATPPDPPAQPATTKTVPVKEPLDTAAQAKILRTRAQVYASEVERIEKNLELVPDAPENADIREKLRRRIDAARKNLQDAQTQLDALD